jgi:hypothetical protein
VTGDLRDELRVVAAESRYLGASALQGRLGLAEPLVELDRPLRRALGGLPLGHGPAQGFDLRAQRIRLGRRGPVEHRPISNVARSVGVAQRAERLLKVTVGRRRAGDHQRPRITAEGILQQTRELRVAVRDVHPARALPLVAQRRDHVAERQEARVYVDALPQPSADGARALGTLASSEVDEMKL